MTVANWNEGTELTLLYVVAKHVWSTVRAYLVKLSSGKYIAWGDADFGADLSEVQVRLDSEGANQIWSTEGAFLAKLSSGKYIAWGRAGCGADLSELHYMALISQQCKWDLTARVQTKFGALSALSLRN